MKLVLPLPPSGNHRLKPDWKRRRLYRTREAKEYPKRVIGYVLAAGVRGPFRGDIVVTAHIFRSNERSDLDNIEKALFDSLQGSVYVNDVQIAAKHVFRHLDEQNPRVEVEVLPA